MGRFYLLGNNKFGDKEMTKEEPKAIMLVNTYTGSEGWEVFWNLMFYATLGTLVGVLI